MSNFSIIYLTNRANPCFDWFCDGLARQTGSGEFPQVIVVDACLWGDAEARKKQLADAVKGRFGFTHVPPKPNVWQGPTRLTTQDYFAASNARNTGACYATTPYLVYCDDLSIFSPGWLDNARDAAQHRYIVAGSYQKVFDLVVEDGAIKSYRENPAGFDCRRGHGSEKGIVKMATPNDFYGCSFGIMLDAYVAVNGFDEIFDGLGYEDTQFGACLAHAGWREKMFYNRNMLTYESEELHHNQGKPLMRIDKGTHPVNMSHALAYGANHPRGCIAPSGRRMPGTYDNPGYRRAIGNLFNLAELRAKILHGEPFPVPTEPQLHWWDGQPLREM